MLDRQGPRPFSALQRYARRATATAAEAAERCELCSEPVPPEHRHLLEVATRGVLCVCQACSILFGQEEASQGRCRLIPDRRRFLEDFCLSDEQWAGLQIPVGMAFFFPSTPAGRVVAAYPGPMGATESMLGLEAWQEVEQANPVLATLAPEVEALLVNRARGAREHYLVPIDECYRLVGLIRRHWKGLGGGQEVWEGIARFFQELRGRCLVVRGSA